MSTEFLLDLLSGSNLPVTIIGTVLSVTSIRIAKDIERLTAVVESLNGKMSSTVVKVENNERRLDRLETNYQRGK